MMYLGKVSVSERSFELLLNLLKYQRKQIKQIFYLHIVAVSF